jgi:hypothetical protein
MYEAQAYYDYNKRGLEDSFTSSDFDLIVMFAHDKLIDGNVVTIKNLVTGVTKDITPEEYEKSFDGEFIYQYTDFE